MGGTRDPPLVGLPWVAVLRFLGGGSVLGWCVRPRGGRCGCGEWGRAGSFRGRAGSGWGRAGSFWGRSGAGWGAVWLISGAVWIRLGAVALGGAAAQRGPSGGCGSGGSHPRRMRVRMWSCMRVGMRVGMRVAYEGAYVVLYEGGYEGAYEGAYEGGV